MNTIKPTRRSVLRLAAAAPLARPFNPNSFPPDIGETNMTLVPQNPRVLAEGVTPNDPCWFPEMDITSSGTVLLRTLRAADSNNNPNVSEVIRVSNNQGVDWTLAGEIVNFSAVRSPMAATADDKIAGTMGDVRPRGASHRDFIGTRWTISATGAALAEPNRISIEGLPRDVEPFTPTSPTQTTYFWWFGNQLDLGDHLLATAYLRYIGDTHFSLEAFVSTDHGYTWRWAGTIGDGRLATSVEGYTEACLARAPAGEVVCYVRIASNFPMMRTTSLDGGYTWSPLTPSNFVSVAPSMTPLRRGGHVATYGRPAMWVAVSDDPHLARWTAVDLQANHIAHYGPIPSSRQYLSHVELAPDHLLVAYDEIPSKPGMPYRVFGVDVYVERRRPRW